MLRPTQMMVIAVLLAAGLDGQPAWAQNADYAATVAQWTSYKDVASWLDDNFTFDQGRQKVVLDRLRSQGPEGLLAHGAATTFVRKSGYCTDAAEFALEALKSINPEYNPRYVFIKNSNGPANHWVIGFHVDGKIYIIDYGAGPDWQAMKGVHGPYDSLEEYKEFLTTLSIRGFRPETVNWRNMPGQLD